MKKSKRLVAWLVALLLLVVSGASGAVFADSGEPQNLVFLGTGKTSYTLTATNSWEYRVGDNMLSTDGGWEGGRLTPKKQAAYEVGNYVRTVPAVADGNNGISANRDDYVLAAKIKKSAEGQKVRLGVVVEVGGTRYVLEINAEDKISSTEFTDIKIPLKTLIQKDNFSDYRTINPETGEMSDLQKTDNMSDLDSRPAVGISIATPVIDADVQNYVEFKYLALEYDPYNAIPVDESIMIGASHNGGDIVMNWTTSKENDIKDYLCLKDEEVVGEATTSTTKPLWNGDTKLHKYCVQARNSQGVVVCKSKDIYVGMSPAEVETNEMNISYIYKDGEGNTAVNSDVTGYTNSWDDKPDNGDGKYLNYAGDLFGGYIGIGGAWTGEFAETEVGNTARGYIKLASSSNHISYSNALNCDLNLKLCKASEDQDVYLGVIMQKEDETKFVLEKDFGEKFGTEFKDVNISLSEILKLENNAVYKSLTEKPDLTQAELEKSKIIGVTVGLKIDAVKMETAKSVSYDKISIIGGETVSAKSAKVAALGGNATVVWQKAKNAAGYYIKKSDGSIQTTTEAAYSGTADETITVYPYLSNGKIGRGTDLTLSTENAKSGNLVITDKAISTDGKKATVLLTAASETKAMLAVCAYNGGVLSAVEVQTATVGTGGAALSAELENVKTGETLKIFVWDSETLAPAAEL